MKKVIFLFFCLFLGISLMPTSSFAYTDGLLDGTQLRLTDGSSAWSYSRPYTGWTSKVTDGDLGTSETISSGASNNRYLWVEFTADMKITQYQFKATGQVWLRFYNASGTLIGSNDLTNLADGVKHNTNANGVRYLVIDENSGSTVVNEFDVWGIGEGTVIQPPDLTPPVTPVNLSATTGNKEVTLNWSANIEKDLEGYKVYQDGVYVTTIQKPGTSATINGLTNGNIYNFQISSIDKSNNESLLSNSILVTPKEPVLLSPKDLIAIPGDNQVDLTWTIDEGASKYNVKRSTSSGGPYIIISDKVTSTNYTDTSAENGKTYYYVVSALNSAGESENSIEVSATPELVVNSRALLVITLVNGLEKEFDLSMTEVNEYINWYIGRSEGSGSELYSFEKSYNLAKFVSRKEYISFSKIEKFEVNEYIVNQ